MEFTHFDGKGNAVMVDVGDKAITSREATAQGEIGVSPECYEKIREGSSSGFTPLWGSLPASVWAIS